MTKSGIYSRHWQIEFTFMKKLHIAFVLSLVALAACSSVPKASDSGGKNSPETVEVTYHIQPGKELAMQAVLSRAWAIYNQEHLVLPQSHEVIARTSPIADCPRISKTQVITSWRSNRVAVV